MDCGVNIWRLLLLITLVPISTRAYHDQDLRPSLSCLLLGDYGCKGKCTLLCKTYGCIDWNPSCDSVYCDCREQWKPIIVETDIVKDYEGLEYFDDILAVRFKRTQVFLELEDILMADPYMMEEVVYFLTHTKGHGKPLKDQFRLAFPELDEQLRRLRPRPLKQPSSNAGPPEVPDEPLGNLDPPKSRWGFLSDWWNRPSAQTDNVEKQRIIDMVNGVEKKEDLLNTMQILKQSGPLYTDVAKHFLQNGLIMPDGTRIVEPVSDPKVLKQSLANDGILNAIENKMREEEEYQKIKKQKQRQVEAITSQAAQKNNQPEETKSSYWGFPSWFSPTRSEAPAAAEILTSAQMPIISKSEYGNHDTNTAESIIEDEYEYNSENSGENSWPNVAVDNALPPDNYQVEKPYEDYWLNELSEQTPSAYNPHKPDSNENLAYEKYEYLSLDPLNQPLSDTFEHSSSNKQTSDHTQPVEYHSDNLLNSENHAWSNPPEILKSEPTISTIQSNTVPAEPEWLDFSWEQNQLLHSPKENSDNTDQSDIETLPLLSENNIHQFLREKSNYPNLTDSSNIIENNLPKGINENLPEIITLPDNFNMGSSSDEISDGQSLNFFFSKQLSEKSSQQIPILSSVPSMGGDQSESDENKINPTLQNLLKLVNVPIYDNMKDEDNTDIMNTETRNLGLNRGSEELQLSNSMEPLLSSKAIESENSSIFDNDYIVGRKHLSRLNGLITDSSESMEEIPVKRIIKTRKNKAEEPFSEQPLHLEPNFSHGLSLQPFNPNENEESLSSKAEPHTQSIIQASKLKPDEKGNSNIPEELRKFLPSHIVDDIGEYREDVNEAESENYTQTGNRAEDLISETNQIIGSPILLPTKTTNSVPLLTDNLGTTNIPSSLEEIHNLQPLGDISLSESQFNEDTGLTPENNSPNRPGKKLTKNRQNYDFPINNLIKNTQIETPLNLKQNLGLPEDTEEFTDEYSTPTHGWIAENLQNVPSLMTDLNNPFLDYVSDKENSEISQPSKTPIGGDYSKLTEVGGNIAKTSTKKNPLNFKGKLKSSNENKKLTPIDTISTFTDEDQITNGVGVSSNNSKNNAKNLPAMKGTGRIKTDIPPTKNKANEIPLTNLNENNDNSVLDNLISQLPFRYLPHTHDGDNFEAIGINSIPSNTHFSVSDESNFLKTERPLIQTQEFLNDQNKSKIPESTLSLSVGDLIDNFLQDSDSESRISAPILKPVGKDESQQALLAKEDQEYQYSPASVDSFDYPQMKIFENFEESQVQNPASKYANVIENPQLSKNDDIKLPNNKKGKNKDAKLIRPSSMHKPTKSSATKNINPEQNVLQNGNLIPLNEQSNKLGDKSRIVTPEEERISETSKPTSQNDKFEIPKLQGYENGENNIKQPTVQEYETFLAKNPDFNFIKTPMIPPGQNVNPDINSDTLSGLPDFNQNFQLLSMNEKSPLLTGIKNPNNFESSRKVPLENSKLENKDVDFNLFLERYDTEEQEDQDNRSDRKKNDKILENKYDVSSIKDAFDDSSHVEIPSMYKVHKDSHQPLNRIYPSIQNVDQEGLYPGTGNDYELYSESKEYPLLTDEPLTKNPSKGSELEDEDIDFNLFLELYNMNQEEYLDNISDMKEDDQIHKNKSDNASSMEDMLENSNNIDIPAEYTISKQNKTLKTIHPDIQNISQGDQYPKIENGYQPQSVNDKSPYLSIDESDFEHYTPLKKIPLENNELENGGIDFSSFLGLYDENHEDYPDDVSDTKTKDDGKIPNGIYPDTEKINKKGLYPGIQNGYLQPTVGDTSSMLADDSDFDEFFKSSSFLNPNDGSKSDKEDFEYHSILGVDKLSSVEDLKYELNDSMDLGKFSKTPNASGLPLMNGTYGEKKPATYSLGNYNTSNIPVEENYHQTSSPYETESSNFNDELDFDDFPKFTSNTKDGNKSNESDFDLNSFFDTNGLDEFNDLMKNGFSNEKKKDSPLIEFEDFSDSRDISKAADSNGILPINGEYDGKKPAGSKTTQDLVDKDKSNPLIKGNNQVTIPYKTDDSSLFDDFFKLPSNTNKDDTVSNDIDLNSFLNMNSDKLESLMGNELSNGERKDEPVIDFVDVSSFEDISINSNGVSFVQEGYSRKNPTASKKAIDNLNNQNKLNPPLKIEENYQQDSMPYKTDSSLFNDELDFNDFYKASISSSTGDSESKDSDIVLNSFLEINDWKEFNDLIDDEFSNEDRKDIPMTELNNFSGLENLFEDTDLKPVKKDDLINLGIAGQSSTIYADTSLAHSVPNFDDFIKPTNSQTQNDEDIDLNLFLEIDNIDQLNGLLNNSFDIKNPENKNSELKDSSSLEKFLGNSIKFDIPKKQNSREKIPTLVESWNNGNSNPYHNNENGHQLSSLEEDLLKLSTSIEPNLDDISNDEISENWNVDSSSFPEFDNNLVGNLDNLNQKDRTPSAYEKLPLLNNLANAEKLDISHADEFPNSFEELQTESNNMPAIMKIIPSSKTKLRNDKLTPLALANENHPIDASATEFPDTTLENGNYSPEEINDNPEIPVASVQSESTSSYINNLGQTKTPFPQNKKDRGKYLLNDLVSQSGIIDPESIALAQYDLAETSVTKESYPNTKTISEYFPISQQHPYDVKSSEFETEHVPSILDLFPNSATYSEMFISEENIDSLSTKLGSNYQPDLSGNLVKIPQTANSVLQDSETAINFGGDDLFTPNIDLQDEDTIGDNSAEILPGIILLDLDNMLSSDNLNSENEELLPDIISELRTNSQEPSNSNLEKLEVPDNIVPVFGNSDEKITTSTTPNHSKSPDKPGRIKKLLNKLTSSMKPKMPFSAGKNPTNDIPLPIIANQDFLKNDEAKLPSTTSDTSRSPEIELSPSPLAGEILSSYSNNNLSRIPEKDDNSNASSIFDKPNNLSVDDLLEESENFYELPSAAETVLENPNALTGETLPFTLNKNSYNSNNKSSSNPTSETPKFGNLLTDVTATGDTLDNDLMTQLEDTNKVPNKVETQASSIGPSSKKLPYRMNSLLRKPKKLQTSTPNSPEYSDSTTPLDKILLSSEPYKLFEEINPAHNILAILDKTPSNSTVEPLSELNAIDLFSDLFDENPSTQPISNTPLSSSQLQDILAMENLPINTEEFTDQNHPKDTLEALKKSDLPFPENKKKTTNGPERGKLLQNLILPQNSPTSEPSNSDFLPVEVGNGDLQEPGFEKDQLGLLTEIEPASDMSINTLISQTSLEPDDFFDIKNNPQFTSPSDAVLNTLLEEPHISLGLEKLDALYPPETESDNEELTTPAITNIPEIKIPQSKFLKSVPEPLSLNQDLKPSLIPHKKRLPHNTLQNVPKYENIGKGVLSENEYKPELFSSTPESNNIITPTSTEPEFDDLYYESPDSEPKNSDIISEKWDDSPQESALGNADDFPTDLQTSALPKPMKQQKQRLSNKKRPKFSNLSPDQSNLLAEDAGVSLFPNSQDIVNPLENNSEWNPNDILENQENEKYDIFSPDVIRDSLSPQDLKLEHDIDNNTNFSEGFLPKVSSENYSESTKPKKLKKIPASESEDTDSIEEDIIAQVKKGWSKSNDRPSQALYNPFDTLDSDASFLPENDELSSNNSEATSSSTRIKDPDSTLLKNHNVIPSYNSDLNQLPDAINDIPEEILDLESSNLLLPSQQNPQITGSPSRKKPLKWRPKIKNPSKNSNIETLEQNGDKNLQPLGETLPLEQIAEYNPNTLVKSTEGVINFSEDPMSPSDLTVDTFGLEILENIETISKNDSESQNEQPLQISSSMNPPTEIIFPEKKLVIPEKGRKPSKFKKMMNVINPHKVAGKIDDLPNEVENLLPSLSEVATDVSPDIQNGADILEKDRVPDLLNDIHFSVDDETGEIASIVVPAQIDLSSIPLFHSPVLSESSETRDELTKQDSILPIARESPIHFSNANNTADELLDYFEVTEQTLHKPSDDSFDELSPSLIDMLTSSDDLFISPAGQDLDKPKPSLSSSGTNILDNSISNQFNTLEQQSTEPSEILPEPAISLIDLLKSSNIKASPEINTSSELLPSNSSVDLEANEQIISILPADSNSLKTSLQESIQRPSPPKPRPLLSAKPPLISLLSGNSPKNNSSGDPSSTIGISQVNANPQATWANTKLPQASSNPVAEWPTNQLQGIKKPITPRPIKISQQSKIDSPSVLKNEPNTAYTPKGPPTDDVQQKINDLMSSFPDEAEGSISAPKIDEALALGIGQPTKSNIASKPTNAKPLRNTNGPFNNSQPRKAKQPQKTGSSSPQKLQGNSKPPLESSVAKQLSASPSRSDLDFEDPFLMFQKEFTVPSPAVSQDDGSSTLDFESFVKSDILAPKEKFTEQEMILAVKNPKIRPDVAMSAQSIGNVPGSTKPAKPHFSARKN